MLTNNKSLITTCVTLALGLSTIQAHATIHVKTIDQASYGKVGTITFDDWGFVGPNGRTATDFEPVNGFNFDAIGQIQHVVTRDPDWLTPDAPATTVRDVLGYPTFGGGNMDGTVQFYQWAYTTKGGSRFSNMLIDKDGDYFIAQDDMNFLIYDTHTHVGTLSPDDPDYRADGTRYTRIAFKPYVLSNAKGWCGSILASNPGALEPMAGQVTFDFAFDVYWQTTPGVFVYSSTEIVRNFEMRSYGTISINVTLPDGTYPQIMSASAVVNNTSPSIHNLQVDGAPTDPNYYNRVSFMGAGVLDNHGQCGILNPNWTGQPTQHKFTGLIDGPTDAASCTAAGGTWQTHAYTGYAYILRADGIRVIEAMDYSTYPDLSNVPHVINGVAYNNDEYGVLQPIANLSDVDGDGINDTDDNCPATPNADQADHGGVNSSTSDGVGDACQCGDVSGDGRITNTDSVSIKRHLIGLPSSFNASFCDVNGDSQCTNADATIIQRAILGLPPGINQSCAAAGN